MKKSNEKSAFEKGPKNLTSRPHLLENEDENPYRPSKPRPAGQQLNLDPSVIKKKKFKKSKRK